MEHSKEIVHQLYNDIAQNSGDDLAEIEEVLLKVYKKLDRVKDDVPLISRLVNYLYFKAHTEQLSFTESQNALIRQLAQIGRKAGLNGGYRADYLDIGQFE